MKDSAKIVRLVFMTAALQAMDQNDLSRFEIDSNDQMVWYPPKTGQCEVNIHPLELLQCSPFLKRKLIAAVRANEGFGVWVQEIVHSKRPLVEKIVREARLSTKDESKSIDLDFFGRFFNQLTNALLWMQRM